MKKIVLLLICFVCICIWLNTSDNTPSPKYDDDVYAIVDFSIISGKPRLFLFENGQCIGKSLCAHGNGQGNTAYKPKFSNEIGSGCSSLGRFKVVGKTTMSNGYEALVLEGLDSTNSNARKRAIYVHHSTLVDICKHGIYPFALPLTNASNGCFAVSTECFNQMKDIYIQHGSYIIYAKK